MSSEQETTTETYFDYAGQPAVGEEGFVTRVRVMSKGKLISERWFDAEGNPMTLGDTYCRVDYTYDKSGNINREKYYDADDQPILCEAGYAIVYREYDSFARVDYEKFYGTDGFAVMLEDGAVSYRYQYNDSGEMIKKTKYDFSDHEVE